MRRKIDRAVKDFKQNVCTGNINTGRFKRGALSDKTNNVEMSKERKKVLRNNIRNMGPEIPKNNKPLGSNNKENCGNSKSQSTENIRPRRMSRRPAKFQNSIVELPKLQSLVDVTQSNARKKVDRPPKLKSEANILPVKELNSDKPSINLVKDTQGLKMKNHDDNTTGDKTPMRNLKNLIIDCDKLVINLERKELDKNYINTDIQIFDLVHEQSKEERNKVMFNKPTNKDEYTSGKQMQSQVFEPVAHDKSVDKKLIIKLERFRVKTKNEDEQNNLIKNGIEKNLTINLIDLDPKPRNKVLNAIQQLNQGCEETVIKSSMKRVEIQPPTKSNLKTMSKPPSKIFRSRNPVNYAELTLNDSEPSDLPKTSNKHPEENKKVPIYKQPICDSSKKHSDEYEFDSDSEKKVPKQKQKKKQDLDNSSLYDKKMKQIMEGIVKKMNKKQKRPQNKQQKVKFKVAKKDLIDGQLELVVNKVEANKISTKNAKKFDKLAVTNRRDGMDNVQPSSPFSDSINGDPCNDDDLNNEPYDDFNDQPPNVDNDITQAFGFEDDCISPITKRKEKIVIHQNVRLLSNSNFNNDVDSPKLFYKRRPTANSTMLGSPFSPWRFNGVFKRKPYYVRLKQSGLPAIEQDPIMDHTFDEGDPIKPNKFVEPTKKPLQTSILNYVTGGEHLKQEETIQSISLFDADQFSPIKTKPSPPDRSPRKILGIRHDILNAVSTPVKANINAIASPGLSSKMDDENKENDLSCFGFDHDSSQEEVNQPKIDKPSRFSLNTFKRYQKKKPKIVREPSPPPIMEESSFEENDTEDDNDDDETLPDSSEVRLFDDPEIPDINPEEPIRNRRKRTKYNISDSPDTHSAKKKKTEKVDPEFNKWVANISAHFSEIENYPLLIE